MEQTNKQNGNEIMLMKLILHRKCQLGKRGEEEGRRQKGDGDGGGGKLVQLNINGEKIIK